MTFLLHSSLPHSHQSGPLTSAYNSLGIFFLKASNSFTFLRKPIPKTLEPHGLMDHNNNPTPGTIFFYVSYFYMVVSKCLTEAL